MADMEALLAARKKKGKKKGKVLNMNNFMDLGESTAETQLLNEYDEDGNIVGVEEVQVVKKVGGLTAAVNASKKKTLEKSPMDDMAEGNWVEEDEMERPVKSLSQGKKVVDLENLPSSQPAPLKSPETIEREEMNRKMFHWTRKQALQGGEAAAAAQVAQAPAEQETPKVYRPRHIMEAKTGEGAAALKQLDNDQIFPALGGAKAKKNAPGAPTASVWGVVKEEVIRELTVKQPDGVFLGEEFLAAEEFQGAKVGYAFKNGANGVGYYWEGPTLDKKDEEVAVEEVSQKEVEEAPVESAEPEEQVAQAQAEVDDAPSEAQKEIDEEKERKRREKKAEKERQKAEWERQEALAKEREIQQQQEKESSAAAPASIPVSAPDAGGADQPPPEDRFAGLKKKKKKKATDA